MTDEPILRLATEQDVGAINRLIAISARALCVTEYTSAQIEAALGSAWGCDSELIRDGTYYVFETDGELIASGGWGKRKTLFGSDNRPDRQSELLDPHRDAARVRAFFVHPDWAGKGLASKMLLNSETMARENGFLRTELMATLTGHPFYKRWGYSGDVIVDYPVANEEVIQFIPMQKQF